MTDQYGISNNPIPCLDFDPFTTTETEYASSPRLNHTDPDHLKVFNEFFSHSNESHRQIM